jgi:selenide,water dikinase
MPAGDDAGVYRLADDVHLVQTVDVMTPCVDDAHLFGRICAANCLSDIYAMGGTPRTALSILAFPSETLHGQIMYDLMAGAMQTLNEAGVALIGGHSIKDEEIKLGFAITGTIDPAHVTARDRAGVGDVLVLTKPLGTGVLGFARQIGRSLDGPLEAAERSMATLNRHAAQAMRLVEARACTDITGFGLFGHLIALARHAGVTAEIDLDALPAFDGVIDLLRQDVVPGAIERNREYVGEDIEVADGADPALVDLGFDAQTSGGLLIAVPPDRVDQLLDELHRRDVSGYCVGRIIERSTGLIRTVSNSPARATRAARSPASASPAREATMNQSSPTPDDSAHSPDCCADIFESASSAGDSDTSAAEAKRAYGALMRSSGQAGAIDERTKELINLALVILRRCEPCLAAHLPKARKMGITEAEIEEIVWCATAMGGACVRVFYDDFMKRQQGGAVG